MTLLLYSVKQNGEIIGEEREEHESYKEAYERMKQLKNYSELLAINESDIHFSNYEIMEVD